MAYPSDYVLQCEKITKTFGSLEVLKEVDIRINAGERRAILGPNGAGKTTLFNIISGELTPSAGKIFIHGDEVTRRRSHTRIRQGFSRTFQLTNLFFDLTALENVIMALHGCRKWKCLHWKPVRRSKDLIAEGRRLLEQFSLAHLAEEKVKNVSYGDQRLLEIALALCSQPSILALDEPSSGLSGGEMQKLIKVLNALDRRLTLLFIEHDMGLVFEVAQEVTVLNHGIVIAEGTLAEIRENSLVRSVYLGEDESC